MDINKIASDLRMENFYFAECFVKRNPNVENGRLSIDLSKDVCKLENNRYTVTLTLNIEKDNEDLCVKVVAVATFSIDNNNDSELIGSVIETNTVAIMFPFIRSQVSLLTTQPGMMPIVLPPINTAKFKSN